MKSPVDPIVLQRFPCFADCNAEETKAVAALLETVHAKSGESIFQQGDPSDSIYLVISGEVEITIHIPGHEDHLLVTLGAGSILGEMGPLLEAPRAASVAAHTDVELGRLSSATVHGALERGDRWATKLLLSTARVLARRIAWLNDELASVIARGEEHCPPAPGKVEAELGRLRKRLLSEWTF